MVIAPWQRNRWQAAALGVAVFLGLCWVVVDTTASRPRTGDASPPADSPVRELGRPSDLPLPSNLSVSAFEDRLFAFLNARQYEKLGWLRDKGVRDTGPYIGGKYYGTHPAVRVYYSPGVVRWLMNGRVGKIPDGEMIVKEQYAAPTARHQGKTEEELWAALESWTVMVKDSAGSHDGWFWSNPAKGQCAADNHRYPFDYPTSGFGQYCVRCHAATQSPGAEPAADTNEFTFASLRNVAGFPGAPLQFRVDDSWRQDAPKPSADDPRSAAARHESHPQCARPKTPERPARVADSGFVGFFTAIKPLALAEVSFLPPVTHDWVVSSRDRSQGFVTSNQCMSCHAGLVAPFGPSMFIPAGAGVEYGAAGWDISPYGEWAWTPMALAGRDPVFYAQVESEMHSARELFRSDPAVAAEVGEALADTCLRCHASMGKRQFDADHPGSPKKFSPDQVQVVAGPDGHVGHGDAKYGALARDGVSCVVCHRMEPREQPPGDHRPYLQYFLETSVTGNFHLGEKGEIYGPFKDDEVAPYAMEHATGLRPKQGAFLKSSQLCGTCHTVDLPNIDAPLDSRHTDQAADDLTLSEVVPLFRKFHHHVEQATYLEWLNSDYENEINPQNPQARSCQDCHMARGLKDERRGIDIAQFRTRIAAIQDSTYPEAENLAPPDRLHVRTRDEGYRRHNFSGLNVFLLEMFDQCDDVLGVRKTDFMTGSKEGIGHAVDNFVRTARNDVAALEVSADWQGPNRLTAHVVVKNKAGHRFPSGVGFRRAFLELLVVQAEAGSDRDERVVWASGRTNELGVLLGADGRPLATEFFDRDPASGQQQYQEHHEVITSPDQVQVYETLLRDAAGRFTTSFVRGCETVKDNRLLPRGWKRAGPGPALTGKFLEATYPDAATAKSPRYADGSGSDEVTYRVEVPQDIDPARLQIRATLYYQAVPPYYLRNLFEASPDGPATRRLHYLCSHLDLKGTPIENWKLAITSATCGVKQGR